MAEEIKEETTEEKKGLKAKTLSLISKIIGGAVILGGYALKVFVKPELDVNDLLKIGFALMGICSTIDFNIMLDKFTKKE